MKNFNVFCTCLYFTESSKIRILLSFSYWFVTMSAWRVCGVHFSPTSFFMQGSVFSKRHRVRSKLSLIEFGQTKHSWVCLISALLNWRSAVPFKLPPPILIRTRSNRPIRNRQLSISNLKKKETKSLVLKSWMLRIFLNKHTGFLQEKKLHPVSNLFKNASYTVCR